MCGRYYVDDVTAREIEKIVRQADAGSIRERCGDIYPAQKAAVITVRTPGFLLEDMVWGFPQYRGKDLRINVRSETVLEKKMFRESVMRRRCIIPARHFYEWDPGKNKVTFSRYDAPVLYMAGFYNRFQEDDRFIILTTEADSSVRSVHGRMSLILESSELEEWVYDDHFFEFALSHQMEDLSNIEFARYKWLFRDILPPL